MPLEDDAGDIIRKARMGRHLSAEELTVLAGLGPEELGPIEQLQRAPSQSQCYALALALGLDGTKLDRIARGQYQPRPQPTQQGAIQVHGLEVAQADGWKSNCWIVGRGSQAVIVDPGAQPERIRQRIQQLGWLPFAIALTHGHHDHIGGVAGLLAEWDLVVLAHARDRDLMGPLAGAVRWVEDRERVPFGAGFLEARHVVGHTSGGLAFVVEGCAFVGDSLFAGSLGRANVPGDGLGQLKAGVRDQILSLPPATVLYPGHGPATTVAEELAANPFFEGAAATAPR